MKNVLFVCILMCSITLFASPVNVSGVIDNTYKTDEINVSNDVVLNVLFVQTTSDFSYSSPFVMSECVYRFDKFNAYNYRFINVTSYSNDVSCMNKGDPNI